MSYPLGSSGVSNSNMPVGSSPLLPQGSSYASVVSGTTSSLSQQYQAARSDEFGNLPDPHEFSYYQSSLNPHELSRYAQSTSDLDLNAFTSSTNGGSQNRSWYGPRGGRILHWSRAFAPVANGFGQDNFLLPSYLKNSKYVHKLEQAHRRKFSGPKEGPAAFSHTGSASRSGSSLPSKTPPSHHGITYDVIEKIPPSTDEMLSPLPSRWNSSDKYGGLEVLLDGLEVKLGGSKSSSERERDHDAYSIRADNYIPSQCGLFYFEVTILSRRREESSIGIGFSSKTVPLSRLPGWEPESWAYHGDDGNSFCCQTSGKPYGPSFTAGDVIGCGINFRIGSAFFTKNGHHLGTAFRDVKGKLYPSVGMKKSGEHVRVNFGQTPFVFDIDGLMRDEQRVVQTHIESTSITKIAPKMNETELVQQLVIQFLQHDGYIETARAFAHEVQAEKEALSLDPDAVMSTIDVKEDEDAGHRQHIRTALLEGDVDKALKHTNTFYPDVLKDNEHVYFRLRCLKFIEMTRRLAEVHNRYTSNGVKSNGHHVEGNDARQNNIWDRMGNYESGAKESEYKRLEDETISYGQDLAAEFKDDPRREIKKSLDDIFSLMAYQNPFAAKEVCYLLDPSGRISVAEELNSAILLSLGKSSSAALENLIQQTTTLIEILREEGGPGAFVNIDDYVNPDKAIDKISGF